jgi:NAD-dependent deacetylase
VMEPETKERVHQVADALCRWRHGVALTGAGISVDSGIPDFRSPGGLWDRFDPMEYATIDAFLAHPERVWLMVQEFDRLLQQARPNPGHLALARLEQHGLIEGLVTQNVDNLHQLAGSKTVVEFHGNGSRLRCPGCDGLVEAARARELGMPPRCPDCGGVLKPDVVFFGEMIPEEAMRRSMELLRGCKVMLVVGTSATVAPASLIPMVAKQNGAFLVEFNLGPTEVTAVCDVAVHASSSESLPLLADRVEQLLAEAG